MRFCITLHIFNFYELRGSSTELLNNKVTIYLDFQTILKVIFFSNKKLGGAGAPVGLLINNAPRNRHKYIL